MSEVRQRGGCLGSRKRKNRRKQKGLCVHASNARVGPPIWYGAVRVAAVAQSWGNGVPVKQSVDRWSRLVLVAAMTAMLGLAACGRKGPLDPPPSAGLA